MPSFNVLDQTIFLTITGSHAYGTSTPDSDVDVRGVCVAPLSVRVGYREVFYQDSSTFQKTTGETLKELVLQAQPWVNPNDPMDDVTIYDVAKAVRLIADNNPNMIELLWGPERCLIKTHPIWECFREIRTSFLSQKCKHTFMGYAHAQYKKIASHRSWLLEPPKAKPERKNFGLPEHSLLSADDRNRIEEAVTSEIRSWQIEDILSGAEQDVLRSRMVDFWSTRLNCQPSEVEDEMKTLAGAQVGLSKEILDLLSAERRYRSALKHWDSYLKWKRERNPKRAALEARHGFDTKHAMHLLRLARMCKEILTEGAVHVYREDFEDLIEVRNGQRSFESIEAEFRKLDQEVEEASKTTALPKTPDHALIEKTLVSVLLG